MKESNFIEAARRIDSKFRSTTSGQVAFTPELGGEFDVLAWWEPYDPDQDKEIIVVKKKRPRSRERKTVTLSLRFESGPVQELSLPAFLRWFNRRINGADGDFHNSDPGAVSEVLDRCADALELRTDARLKGGAQ